MKPVNWIIILVIALGILSCNDNAVLDKSEEISNREWNIKQVIKLETEISETAVPYNFYVNIRHTATYPYSNLYVFVTTEMPGGKSIRDTLECVLADDKGRWLGKTAGNIVDHRIPFKRNIKFPQPGKYLFQIEQAMRMEKLPEVLDAGLRIEKAQN